MCSSCALLSLSSQLRSALLSQNVACPLCSASLLDRPFHGVFMCSSQSPLFVVVVAVAFVIISIIPIVIIVIIVSVIFVLAVNQQGAGGWRSGANLVDS